jgi:succinate-semialdehyde dehydrogenase/glutarate-semialdehyde dehydrogenase
VLAVMPWNFPFWQVIRFAAPALMAGNVGLLKHASNVPRCALALEALFTQAGFTHGAFQSLLIDSKRVTKLIDDPRIRAVTLTGSEAAGVSVASQAGKQLKKSVLELGGSDPFIVMPSADIAEAAKTAVTARNINNGQSCIAAKRFIVHERVYEEFERRMVEALKQLKVGDPMREDTDIGPIATEAGRDGIADQVERSVQAGAKLLIGGKKLPGSGFYYAATALTDIPESAPVYREEVFGPVALLFKVKSAEEAIALANDSDFGLGSSVWTRDAAERERFVNELEAGLTFVNAMVASDPRLPFGGVKRSGFGRELGSLGIREFVNIKSVVIHDAAPAAHPASE